MRRVLALGLAVAVLGASGCARQAPRGEVSAPVVAEQGPVGAGAPGAGPGAAGAGAGSPDPGASTKPAPLGLAAITGAPVDWVESFPPREPRTLPPLTENACATDGTGLTVDLRSAEWAPHPLAAKPFWTPSAVVVACNATALPAKAPRLEFRFDWGDGKGGQGAVTLPALSPGQAVGPIRLFGVRGVPATVGGTWQEHGERWPSVTAAVAMGEQWGPATPVRRALAGSATEAPGGGAPFPATPTLEDLRKLSWSQADRGEQGQFFLYAPDMIRTVETNDFCGSVTGMLNASAMQWAVYHSVGGGAPAKVLEVGARSFPGERGMTAATVSSVNTTFLFFGDYGSCANPTFYDIYAYDHATKTGYQPQMKREDGRVTGASSAHFTLEPDGTLTSKSYDNAVGKWHTYTYRWDGPARTWVIESHVAK